MISLNKKRICAVLLTLLLTIPPQTSGLFVMRAAALNFYVENAVSGTIAKPTADGVVTHYEFNVAEGASSASFQVSITGDDFTEPIFVSMVSDESDSHPVSAISINGGGSSATIPNALPFTVVFTLNGGSGYATGDVRMDISVNSTRAPLGSVPFVVNKGSGDAAADPGDDSVSEEDEEDIIDPDAENDYSDFDGESAGHTPDGIEDFVRILEDADYLPDIVIDGNVARLTYVTGVASWDAGETARNVLTLSDISLLEPDTPLEIPGPGQSAAARSYTVTLPARHINAVLEAKAADIAAKLTASAYREEPEGHSDSMLLLAPSHMPAELGYARLSPLTGGFEPAGEGSLAIYADSQALLALESPAVIEAAVFYKGIAAPLPARLTLPVLRADEPESANSQALVNGVLVPLNNAAAKNGMTARGVGVSIFLAAVLAGVVFLLLRARRHMRVR